ILLKTVKGFCCLMQEIKNGIDRTHLNSIGVMLFPFIIIKTKIGIIWLHCKWQYCLYSYQYSPSAGIK
ncbi:hypothetical protein, partial [Parabacteroides merdae]|uniref:hypothetical protein n=1 Tax=Parabacteroides merdae TaxID=46503 RepID=UPI0034A3179E